MALNTGHRAVGGKDCECVKQQDGAESESSSWGSLTIFTRASRSYSHSLSSVAAPALDFQPLTSARTLHLPSLPRSGGARHLPEALDLPDGLQRQGEGSLPQPADSSLRQARLSVGPAIPLSRLAPFFLCSDPFGNMSRAIAVSCAVSYPIKRTSRTENSIAAFFPFAPEQARHATPAGR